MLRRALVGAVAALLLIVLVACSGQTSPATDVTDTSATLNAETSWDQGDGPGELWFEIATDTGAFAEVAGSRAPFGDLPSSGGPIPYSKPANGLQPATVYRFRLCGYGDKDFPTTTVCTDADGTTHNPSNPEGEQGVSYDRFTTDPAPPADGWTPGIVANADLPKAARVADNLGASTVRVEFHIGASTSAIDATVNDFANRGIRVLLLAGFHSQVPTAAQAQNLANWANRYGPGGTLGLPAHLAVRHIEFGNETSYSYQYPCPEPWYISECYRARANWYALRAKDAAQAIAATGRDVGLLVQADHGGSGAPTWVDEMYESVPNLDDYVAGWTVHPYGPNYTDKPLKAAQQTAAHGAPASIPIDVTEYGLSSRDGQPVSNNYGWPTNQTYAQAAAALQQAVDGLRANATFGDRLRHFMVYATYDLQPVGAGTDREWYFGCVKSDESAKGAYTPKCQDVLAGGGGGQQAAPFRR